MGLEIEIGDRIRELRQNADLSQEELALKAGLDRTYINSVENGRRNITINTLQKITSTLNISLSQFFDSPIFDRKENN